MPQPTILASFVASFVDYAETQGVARGRLLGALETTETALSDPDGRIPASAYRTMQAMAIRETGDSGLPMRHASATNGDKLSVVGLIFANAGSLANAIEQLNRYTRIIADVPLSDHQKRFDLVEDRHGTWLLDRLPSWLGGPSAIEVTLTNFMSRNQAHPDRILPAKAVWLEFEEPPHRPLYDEVFEMPIQFGTDRNGFLLKDGWDRPWTSGANSYALDLFTQHADTLVKSLETSVSFIDRVEAVILKDLPSGHVTVETVASRLALAPRTLHRRLQAEGTTFSGVLDRLRFRLAGERLKAGGASVAEIAYMLGFSEASTFVRAFKRWSGQTPSAYRTRA